jgi:NADPH-dependent 2,4-dienoyl-CoA reductase/sulfur reductase-like enzyme
VTRHVIIGTGISGFSAAQTLRSLDPSAEIYLVGDDPHGFYSRPGLAYYLSGELPEKQLFPFNKKGHLDLQVNQVLGRVTRVDPASHSIELNASRQLDYDRLLLATGASAVPLKVPGAEMQGVVKLDNLEDTRLILSLARRAKRAVVVGGGVVGLELVEGLVAQGIKTHYLIRGDWFWSNVLVEAESRLVEHHLTRAGVKLHHTTEIVEVLSKKGKIAGVQTSAGEVIRCDLVAVGIGVRPSLELAIGAGLKTERGILVNEYLQTSQPDIFAAGDVAQIFDPRTGRSAIDNLWYPGRKQGQVAATNMTGQREVYKRSVATNVLRLADMMITIIGPIGSGRNDGEVYTTRGSSETWQQLPNTIAAESNTEMSHLRLVMDERFILGAVVMGDQKIASPLREMINHQVDITPIRPQLLQSGPTVGKHIIDYWLQTRS